ncbi:MAG: hypothetical protein MJ223_03030 [Mycoplasmoidaceae bacterium]|nr:hypothetical protein [Mycoplasmoidaceae bacterium]
MNVIISDGSPFIRFFDRQDFKQVLQNELDVLAACEKIFPKEKVDDKLKAKSLIKKFDSLSKTTLRLNQDFKYDDQTDLIDSINYLVTFCNNMFRVNLDDLVAGKKVTPTDPKIDLRSKPQFDDDQRINSNFAFASGIGAILGETPYQNPYLVSKAYEKLSDDMKAGTFYQYKTKPRIIPIVK